MDALFLIFGDEQQCSERIFRSPGNPHAPSLNPKTPEVSRLFGETYRRTSRNVSAGRRIGVTLQWRGEKRPGGFCTPTGRRADIGRPVSSSTWGSKACSLCYALSPR